MYEFFQGEVVEISDQKLVLAVGGIGYAFTCPLSTMAKISVGQKVFIYAHLVVREDAHLLYGFYTKQERFFFDMLGSVAGIGPKTAIGMMSHMEMGLFVRAILDEDHRLLSKLPGVGKKTAERLVVELKDKVHKIKCVEPSLVGSAHRDVYLALEGLGFSMAQVEPFFKELQKEEPGLTQHGEIIKKLLQRLYAHSKKR